jgi:excisionase family DNA binding protein
VTPRVLTPEQVAEALGCHPRTVEKMCAAGELPSIRVGNRIRIPVVQFDQWLAGTWEPRRSPKPVDLIGRRAG